MLGLSSFGGWLLRTSGNQTEMISSRFGVPGRFRTAFVVATLITLLWNALPICEWKDFGMRTMHGVSVDTKAICSWRI